MWTPFTFTIGFNFVLTVISRQNGVQVAIEFQNTYINFFLYKNTFNV